MTRVSPAIRSLAARLVRLEIDVEPSNSSTTALSLNVSDKLRSKLTMLLGSGGFTAVLVRALVLGAAEVPWFKWIQFNSEGRLEGTGEIYSRLNLEKLMEGEEVLLAHLLALLVAFIGERLTVQLVLEIWPGISLDDLKFGKDVKNEKTN